LSPSSQRSGHQCCSALPYLSPANPTSGPIAAAAKPVAYSFTNFSAVALSRRSPPTAGNSASWITGVLPSSGSEYHLLTADSPWTALFAATGGPSDGDAYITSSGSEHPLLAAAADIVWTDFITAIGGHSETNTFIASAGNF
jgi:hypothetical protein